MRWRAPCGRRPRTTGAPRLRGNIHGHREPRSCAGSFGRRVGRTTGAIADRMAYQVSLACAPRSPGLRCGGTRDPAAPPHPQRHPCRRGVGLRRFGHCPPGTAPPSDRSDVRAAQALSPTDRPRATSLGVGCDPRLRHGQRRGFWDPRLGSGSPTAPARPPTTFRQVAPALLCRARRVPGNPRLTPVETPPTIHDPIAPWNVYCASCRYSALPVDQYLAAVMKTEARAALMACNAKGRTMDTCVGGMTVPTASRELRSLTTPPNCSIRG